MSAVMGTPPRSIATPASPFTHRTSEAFSTPSVGDSLGGSSGPPSPGMAGTLSAVDSTVAQLEEVLRSSRAQPRDPRLPPSPPLEHAPQDLNDSVEDMFAAAAASAGLDDSAAPPRGYRAPPSADASMDLFALAAKAQF